MCDEIINSNSNISYQEVYEACQKYRICHINKLKIISYIALPSILQVGPQCGIAAAAMCTNTDIECLMKEAKSLHMTNNGEMFSAKHLADLIKQHLKQKTVFVYDGNNFSNQCINVLKKNGLVIVPYDADKNHTPCLKRGHKAHWAVLCGLVHEIDFPESLLTIARHGKSKHLAFWNINDLAASNSQLEEFSPAREASELTYILPEDGISGPNGLKNKAIFIT